jgi:hypothetical protein
MDSDLRLHFESIYCIYLEYHISIDLKLDDMQLGILGCSTHKYMTLLSTFTAICKNSKMFLSLKTHLKMSLNWAQCTMLSQKIPNFSMSF